MIADRVLDDVGLNPCRLLRGFLFRCFTPCIHRERGVSVAWSLFVSALITIMRNLVMRLSMPHDAISGISEDELGSRVSVRLIPLDST